MKDPWPHITEAVLFICIAAIWIASMHYGYECR